MHWMIHGSRESEIGSEKDGQRLQGHLSINRLRTLTLRQRRPGHICSRSLQWFRGSQPRPWIRASMQVQVPPRVCPEPTGDVRERPMHRAR